MNVAGDDREYSGHLLHEAVSGLESKRERAVRRLRELHGLAAIVPVDELLALLATSAVVDEDRAISVRANSLPKDMR